MNSGNGAAWWLSLVVVSLVSPSAASACSARIDGGIASCTERAWTSLPEAGAADVATNPVFYRSFAWPSPDTERVPIVRRASEPLSLGVADLGLGG